MTLENIDKPHRDEGVLVADFYGPTKERVEQLAERAAKGLPLFPDRED